MRKSGYGVPSIRRGDRSDHNYVIFDESDVTIEEVEFRRQRNRLDRIVENTTPKPGRAQANRGKPLGAAGVRKAIQSVVEQWNAQVAPPVRVVDSAAELPDRIRRQIDKTPDAGAPDGVFDPATGTIFLIGDQITSKAHAHRVLAHEAVGHHSMQEMLGDEFAKVAADVLRLAESGKGPVSSIADEVFRDYGDLPPETLAAEVIAHMAERGIKNSIMTRVVAAIRRFLRSLGLRLPYSLREVNNMIARAAKRLQTETTSTPRGEVSNGWFAQASRVDEDNNNNSDYPKLRAAHAIHESQVSTLIRRGSLVAPSIAIQPAGVPLQFGGNDRVALVFKPDAINFRSDNVRSGDFYSPTEPDIINRS